MKGDTNLNIYYAFNLIFYHIALVLKEEKEITHKEISESYDKFSVTIDGSPIGDITKAIFLRLTKKKSKKIKNYII